MSGADSHRAKVDIRIYFLCCSRCNRNQVIATQMLQGMNMLRIADADKGYRALAAAAINQAAQDVKGGDVLAEQWLLGLGFDLATGLLGMRVSPDHWRRWVANGCPGRYNRSGRPPKR